MVCFKESSQWPKDFILFFFYCLLSTSLAQFLELEIITGITSGVTAGRLAQALVIIYGQLEKTGIDHRRIPKAKSPVTIRAERDYIAGQITAP